MLARITAFLASPLGRVLRLLLSLTLIGWLVLTIDWHSFSRLGENFSPALFLAALLVALTAYPLCALRWHRLLRSQNVPLSFARAHRIVWIGQFYNAFLPGGIGGDAARLAHAFATAPAAKPAIVTATLLDRLIGFAALLLLGSGAALLIKNSAITLVLSPIVSIVAISLLLLPPLALLLIRRFSSRLPTNNWSAALIQSAHDQRSVLFAATVSMAVWILDFLSGWLLALSLGLDIAFLSLCLALTLAYLSTLLPISLGGHGLREGTFLVILVALSEKTATPDSLAPLGFLFLVVTLLTSAVGGLALLPSKNSAPSSAAL